MVIMLSLIFSLIGCGIELPEIETQTPLVNTWPGNVGTPSNTYHISKAPTHTQMPTPTQVASPVNDYSFLAISVTDDGGIIAGGNCYAAGYTNNGVLIKFDKNGTKIWEKSFDAFDYVNDIIETSDGGFIVVGGNILYKLDKDGNKLWESDELKGSNAYIGQVLQTKEGDYIAGGSLVTDKGDDAFIVKLDSSGRKIWNISYDFCHNYYREHEYVTSITELSDGSFAAVGYFECENSAFIVKFDSSGNKIWDNTEKYNDTYSIRRPVLQLESGNICTISSAIEKEYQRLFAIMIYDNNGNLVKKQWYDIKAGNISIIETDKFLIAVSITSAKKYTLYKLDLDGNIIWSKCIEENLNNLSKNNLHRIIYSLMNLGNSEYCLYSLISYNEGGYGSYIYKFDNDGNLK